MNEFAKHSWPRHEACPVYYPFCGVDLTNLQGLFPNASEVFMMAALPMGSFTCFLDEGCRFAATNSVLRYFKLWSDREHGMAWAGTGQMLESFNAGYKGKHPGTDDLQLRPGAVGLLPTLLATMYLLAYGTDDHNATLLTDFEEHTHHLHASNETSSLVKLAWRNCSAHLSYLSTWVDIPAAPIELPHATSVSEWVTAPESERYVDQMKRISHTIGLGDRLRVTMFKAAEPMHGRFLNDNGVARWFLDVSAALVHDPTGLRPFIYSHPVATRSTPWELRAYGEFRGFSRDPRSPYVVASAEEELEYIQLAARAPSPLTFEFGYDGWYRSNASKGLVIAAWRHGWLQDQSVRKRLV